MQEIRIKINSVKWLFWMWIKILNNEVKKHRGKSTGKNIGKSISKSIGDPNFVVDTYIL